MTGMGGGTCQGGDRKCSKKAEKDEETGRTFFVCVLMVMKAPKQDSFSVTRSIAVPYLQLNHAEYVS